MSVDASPLTVRVPLPYDIVRGVATVLIAPIYRDGAAVVASAATCTVYDAGGTAVATDATAIVSDVPTGTFGATVFDDESYDDGWRVEWSITHAGGVLTSRHEAALCRAALYPVITDDDLYRRYRGLDASAGVGAALTARTDWQDSIDEAWVQIMLRVREQGKRPHLVMSPSALREAHTELSLALLLADVALSHGQGGDFLELSLRHRAQYEAAWTRLRWVYDADDDGEPDAGRGSPISTVWLC